MKQEEYEKTAELVLGELDEALHLVAPDSVERLLEAVDAADQVFFVGVGRVMLALEAIAKRWAHLGVKTHLVGEITEPAITPNDLLIVGSGSGTTLFPAGIAQRRIRLEPRLSTSALIRIVRFGRSLNLWFGFRCGQRRIWKTRSTRSSP